jgi:hypothetical protein
MDVARRAFLKGAGALGLLALANPTRVAKALIDAPGPGQAGRFLKAHELDALRAVCARLIPGPPEDPDPGALEAGVPEAIDLLLGAFKVDPPLIHAGGPFSNRAGAHRDDFAHFVPLDAHAELGWRIRLEGTKGIKAREFAGPVVGLQQIYREGLAHLDERAGGDFASLPGLLQDAILLDLTDDQTQTFLGAALANSFEAMYGPPEYGGNRKLVGWKNTEWPGDVQPRGFTPAEVEAPGEGPHLDLKMARAFEKFMPALAGKAASRDAFWLGRAGFNRG